MTTPATVYDGFSYAGKPGYNRYSPGTLLTVPRVDVLDLIASIGQRRATFRWDLINGVTGVRLGELQPLMDTPAQLTHDVTRAVKRDLRISLDAADLAEVNPLTDRVLPFMLIAGTEWPLGRYMFTGDVRAVRSRGDDGAMLLMDEMNLVDQEITNGFASISSCDGAIRELVAGLNLPQGVDIAASPYTAKGPSWQAGSRRGSIIGTLSVIGDLETPWMDNAGVMRGVRTVDPATSVPALSFDDGYPVFAETISQTNNLLEAPNRFVVIGNGSASQMGSVTGVYDIPPSASHSIANRGFVIQRTENLNISTSDQAQAAARNLGMSSLPVEQVDLTTPPDPRHDGYQVVRWAGENWLEIAWSMNCVEGGDMSHSLRRAYAP